MRVLPSQHKLDRLVWYCFTNSPKIWSRRRVTIPLPAVYKTAALPTWATPAKLDTCCFCVQMQLRRLLYVPKNGSDGWTRTSKVSRQINSLLRLLFRHIRINQTRLKRQFFFNVLNSQEDLCIFMQCLLLSSLSNHFKLFIKLNVLMLLQKFNKTLKMLFHNIYSTKFSCFYFTQW